MVDGNDTGRRPFVQQGQTDGTGQMELAPRDILPANVPEVDPPGTASGLTWAPIKERGLDDTFAGWIQLGGEVTRPFTGSLISNLVEEYVQRLVMPLRLENARLKSKLNDLEEHWVPPEEFERLKSRLDELEEGRILRFRLPAGYLDEEPEEM